MRIRVRTKDIRLFIPIPDAMVGFAARFIPERAFEAYELTLLNINS